MKPFDPKKDKIAYSTTIRQRNPDVAFRKIDHFHILTNKWYQTAIKILQFQNKSVHILKRNLIPFYGAAVKMKHED